MWPCQHGDNRSQSEILGTVLVFSLVITVGTILVGAGIVVFNDAGNEFEDRLGQDSLQEVDSRLTNAEGGTVLEFPNDASDVEVTNEQGFVNVNVTTLERGVNITPLLDGISNPEDFFDDVNADDGFINISEENIKANSMTNETGFPLGTIRHESSGGVETIYQGGLLFEREGGQVRILSSPNFDFRALRGEQELANIEFGLTSLQDAEINSNGEAYVESDELASQEFAAHVEKMIRLHRTLNGTLENNPTTNVDISIKLDTEYPTAWATFAVERMSDEPETVRVQPGTATADELPDSNDADVVLEDVENGTVAFDFPTFGGDDLKTPDFPQNIVYSGVSSISTLFYNPLAGQNITLDGVNGGLAVVESGDGGSNVNFNPGDPADFGLAIADEIGGEPAWKVLDTSQVAGGSGQDFRWTDVSVSDSFPFDDPEDFDGSASDITSGGGPADSSKFVFKDGATICMVAFDDTVGSSDDPPSTNRTAQKVADGDCTEVTIGDASAPRPEPELVVTNVDTASNSTNLEVGDKAVFTATIDNVGDGVANGSFVGARADLGLSQYSAVDAEKIDKLYPANDSIDVTMGFRATADFNDDEPVEVVTRDDTYTIPESEFEVQDAPYFKINNVDNNTGAKPGDQFDVNVTVENTGAQDTQTVSLFDDDGALVDAESITLTQNEDTAVNLTWNVPEDQDFSGTTEVEVTTEVENETIEVNRLPEALITNVDVTDTVPSDATVPVEVTLENPSEDLDKDDAEVKIDQGKSDLLLGGSSTGGPTTYDTPGEYTIPVSSVDRVSVKLQGAGGGDGWSGGYAGTTGGSGGYIEAEIDTTGITELKLWVGGAGANGDVSDTSGGFGRIPGGDAETQFTGAGGGATEIWADPGAATERFVVAADGGGGGGDDANYGGGGGGGSAGGAGAEFADDSGSRSVFIPVESSKPSTAIDEESTGGAGGVTGDDGGDGGWVYNNNIVDDMTTVEGGGAGANQDGRAVYEPLSSSTIVTSTTVDIDAGDTETVTLNPAQATNPVTDWVPVETGDDSAEEVGVVDRNGPNCGAVSYAGSGTSSDPYQISNVDELQCIQNSGLYDNNANFEVVDDIAAHGTVNWQQTGQEITRIKGGLATDPYTINGFRPIGPRGNAYPHDFVSGSEPGYSDPFDGTFDGKGYEIEGLYIEAPDMRFVGLFGATSEVYEAGTGVGATVKNLVISDAFVHGNQHVGILAGQAGGTVLDSRVEGEVIGEHSIVGGMIGDGYEASLDNRLVANVTVTGGDMDPSAGLVYGSDGGTLNAEGVGGIIGRTSGQTDFSVGYANADVTANRYAGSIAGTSSYIQSEFRQSYAIGSVEVNDGPPGVVGYSEEGAIVGSILRDDDRFLDSVFWNQDTYDSGIDWYGEVGNEESAGLDISDGIGDVAQTDTQPRSTDEMQGPSVLPDDPSFDYDQYPGVTQADAEGHMAELDWDIWEPVYETEIDPATGDINIVNESYPIFEWEAEGFLTVEILDASAVSGASDNPRPDPMTPGADDMEVTVRVNNTGDTSLEDTIILQNPTKGKTAAVDSETVSLGPGGSTEFTLTWTTGIADRLSQSEADDDGLVVVRSSDDADTANIEFQPFIETNIGVEDLELPDAIEALNEQMSLSDGTGPNANFTIVNIDPRTGDRDFDDPVLKQQFIGLEADGVVVDAVTAFDLVNNNAELTWTPAAGDVGQTNIDVTVLGTPRSVSGKTLVVTPAQTFTPGQTVPFSANVDFISGGS